MSVSYRKSAPPRSQPRLGSHRHRPAARVPEALRDEPSRSIESHSEHFLVRVLRCEGEDLNRAMRLYHHSPIVRKLVPELMDNLFPDHARAAIPLRPGGERSAHVVITRGGAFVTCLAEHMSVQDLPILPYQALDHEITKEEIFTGRLQRHDEVVAALSPEKLMRVLLLGDAPLTREMARVVEKDPWAYDFIVFKVYASLVGEVNRWVDLKARFGHQEQLHRAFTWLERRLCNCALLIGALTGELTEQMEPYLVDSYSLASWHLATALARKPGRGRVLMKGVNCSKSVNPDWVRSASFDGALMHCLWYPEEARWLIPTLAELPPPQCPLSWYNTWACDDRLGLSPEGYVAWFRDSVELMAPNQAVHDMPNVTDNPRWDFALQDLLKMTVMRRSVADFFPPAAIAQEVMRAFAAHARNAPRKDPHRAPTKPVVRDAPRVERNGACPCGSGRKFKRCCIDRESRSGSAVDDRESRSGSAVDAREAPSASPSG